MGREGGSVCGGVGIGVGTGVWVCMSVDGVGWCVGVSEWVNT